jgi:hypothetical protein
LIAGQGKPINSLDQKNRKIERSIDNIDISENIKGNSTAAISETLSVNKMGRGLRIF